MPSGAGACWLVSVSAAALLTTLTTAQAYASRRVEGLPARVDRILPFSRTTGLPGPSSAGNAHRGFLVAWRKRSGVRFGLTWIGIGVAFAGFHALLEVIAARSLGYVPTQMPFTTMLPARVAGTLVGRLIVVCLVALSYDAVASYREGLLREQREARSKRGRSAVNEHSFGR